MKRPFTILKKLDWNKNILPGLLFILITASVFGQNVDQRSQWEQFRSERNYSNNLIIRSQQTHAGFPVYGSVQVVVEDNHGIKSTTGEQVEINVTRPSRILDLNVILKSKSLPDQLTIHEQPALTWYFLNEQFRLVWIICGNTELDLRSYRWFIDAENGNLYVQEEMYCTINTTGTAHTEYFGTRPIGTIYDGNSYTLSSTARGLGIETFNLNQQLNYNSVTGYSDQDNVWNAGEAIPVKHASDAHY
jgi:Zn-dependent metalloprotease